MISHQDDLLGSLFEHRDRRLDRLGNPLLELDEPIDWDTFRPLLDKARLKERKSSAGRKPWDVILMFKSLVLASLYNLSDEQLEFQIEDRRSFQSFIGLSDARHAPDRNSFWLFRELFKELKLTETLLNEFNRQLDRAGLIARKGQLIDASFVKARFSATPQAEMIGISQAKRSMTGLRTNAARRIQMPAGARKATRVITVMELVLAHLTGRFTNLQQGIKHAV